MKILVGIDFSESTEKIAKKTEEIATALSAKIWLLHVAEPEPDCIAFKEGLQSERDFLAKKFHEEHCQIQEIADRFRETGLDTTALLVQGITVKVILNQASKLNVDMIVVGSHGRGMVYQLLVGSVSEELLHKSEYPILVIPTHKRT